MMKTSVAGELGYPYEDDPFSYQELTLGPGDAAATRDIDRDRFLAVLALNQEMAAAAGARVRVRGTWECGRCGGQCSAEGAPGPAGGPPLALAPDLHVCTPAGWIRKIAALYSGTGAGTLVLVPEVPRRMVAVVIGPPAPASPAGC